MLVLVLYKNLCALHIWSIQFWHAKFGLLERQ